MKVGDLVKNGQGHTGVVTAIASTTRIQNLKSCEIILYISNPDIYVVTAQGKRIWSYNALELISESR